MVAVDAKEIAYAIVGQIRHFRKTAFNTSIVAMVYEAFMDARVVAQAISVFQSSLCCPCSRGDLHAINGINWDDLRAVRGASIQIKQNVSRHVISGAVDRPNRTIKN